MLARTRWLRPALVVWCGAALLVATPTRGDDAAKKTAAAESEARLKRDVTELASDELEGRGPTTKGLYLAIKETTIDHVIEQTPNDAHYFVGTVVWQPGELQAEVDRGFWSVMAPDAGVVFDHDPEKLWEHLQAKAGAVSASASPDDAFGANEMRVAYAGAR